MFPVPKNAYVVAKVDGAGKNRPLAAVVDVSRGLPIGCSPGTWAEKCGRPYPRKNKDGEESEGLVRSPRITPLKAHEGLLPLVLRSDSTTRRTVAYVQTDLFAGEGQERVRFIAEHRCRILPTLSPRFFVAATVGCCCCVQAGPNGRIYGLVEYPSVQELWKEVYDTRAVRAMEVRWASSSASFSVLLSFCCAEICPTFFFVRSRWFRMRLYEAAGDGHPTSSAPSAAARTDARIDFPRSWDRSFGLTTERNGSSVFLELCISPRNMVLQ